MFGHPETTSGGAIHFFVDFAYFKWLYLAYYWVFSRQTWGFCKLGDFGSVIANNC